MEQWITVAKTDELGPGKRDVVEIDGYDWIAVFNVDGTYYAFRDACSHDDESIAEGDLHGFQLECPRHGARFDVRTGEALTPPAVKDIKRYDVRVKGNEVQILYDE